MSSGAKAPGFITHRALEDLLGGGDAGAQQRRRLTARGLLPEAEWIRVDRTRLALYPHFALLALVGNSTRKEDERLLRDVVQACREVMQSANYTHLLAAASDALRSTRDTDLDVIASFIGSRGDDVLAHWRDEVDDAMESLRGLGAGFECEMAEVIEARRQLIIVQFRDGHSFRYPREAALSKLWSGSCVARERFSVSAVSRDFLAPATPSADSAPQGASSTQHVKADDVLDWSAVSDADWQRALEQAAADTPAFDESYWELQPPSAAEPTSRVRPIIRLDDITTDWGKLKTG